MLQVWSQISSSTKVFIDHGNDPCPFTTEEVVSTPAGAEPWRSGRCFSVCLS